MLTCHLVLGGARSGKSRFAEALITDLAAPTDSQPARQQVYVATGQAADDEMAERIAHHRSQRDPNEWVLIEEPLEIAAVLRGADAGQVILIDCLTLWLTNLYSAGRQGEWSEVRTDFLAALAESRADVVLVSNEVGFGVVPLGAETRWFVDEIGRLHQAVAQVCTHVSLVAAGLPLELKSPG